MNFFRKNKSNSLVKELKKRPNEMIVTAEYMAVYWTAMEKLLIIHGDYRSLTDEEANFVLINKINQIRASMN